MYVRDTWFSQYRVDYITTTLFLFIPLFILVTLQESTAMMRENRIDSIMASRNEFNCTICYSKFSSKKNLKHHDTSVHQKVEGFIGVLCGQATAHQVSVLNLAELVLLRVFEVAGITFKLTESSVAAIIQKERDAIERERDERGRIKREGERERKDDAAKTK